MTNRDHLTTKSYSDRLRAGLLSLAARRGVKVLVRRLGPSDVEVRLPGRTVAGSCFENLASAVSRC